MGWMFNSNLVRGSSSKKKLHVSITAERRLVARTHVLSKVEDAIQDRERLGMTVPGFDISFHSSL